VLNRVGDTWSVLVVVELAPVRRLERDGLVTRTVFPTVPAQVSYSLTESGASLTHLIKGAGRLVAGGAAGHNRSPRQLRRLEPGPSHPLIVVTPPHRKLQHVNHPLLPLASE
jgi:DNA-binding HxlR family transcriptional regulator